LPPHATPSRPATMAVAKQRRHCNQTRASRVRTTRNVAPLVAGLRVVRHRVHDTLHMTGELAGMLLGRVEHRLRQAPVLIVGQITWERMSGTVAVQHLLHGWTLPIRG
jgi:hypothetical protein